MGAIYIDKHLKDWILGKFPESYVDKFSNWWGRGQWFWSRRIVLKSSLKQEQDPSAQVRYVLHYEHFENENYSAHIELRIMNPKSADDEDFAELAAWLKERYPNDSDYVWETDSHSFTACRNKRPICRGEWDEAEDVFSKMKARFEPAIIEFFKTEQENGGLPKADVLRTSNVDENGADGTQDVELYTLTLLQLLNLKLRIPDYQRIYCWDEKTIRVLWDDVRGLNGEERYRLGTIILQKKDGYYDIIDGQQRLVTLSLMLLALNIKDGISLLDQTYQSHTAEAYIAYNKYIINNLLSGITRSKRRGTAERLWNGIEFSVLILNDSSLDLAYTFFSNENSRGKALSDFDLLKAHHLRYITDNPVQSRHLAKKWDRMILTGDDADSESERAYVRSLSLYVFRLRHWIRMQNWDDNVKYNVKHEYEAAEQIPEIPPFGESFDWNESIQGGAHFFAYVDNLLSRFESFAATDVYKAIHRLDMETHRWYRDVIESLLFSYYLKFGDIYLAEAMMLIARRISSHRYDNARVRLGKIQQFAADTRIVMMVDRATSPTFFLGELSRAIRENPSKPPKKKIQIRYDNELRKCFDSCRQHVEISSITYLI